MRCAKKAHKFQSVKIRSTKRLTTNVEQTITVCKVTNILKLMEWTSQATTQVKVLSSEIYHVIEADIFALYGRQQESNVLVSYSSLYRSQSPLHVMIWKLCELGRSITFPSGYVRTSCNKRGLTNDVMEVGLIDSTLSVGKPRTWGSSQQWRNRLRDCSTNTLRLDCRAR